MENKRQIIAGIIVVVVGIAAVMVLSKVQENKAAKVSADLPPAQTQNSSENGKTQDQGSLPASQPNAVPEQTQQATPKSQTQPKPTPAPKPAAEPAIILFVGEGCPHCAKVEEFIQTNNIASKVQFRMLEVYNNQDNAKLLVSKAEICKIDTKSIGVPFLWDGSNCIVGEIDVTEFFKAKAGIN